MDDSPANLVALESVLASPEHELVKARSGHEALGYLLKNDCALILMDVQMPVMDGYETAALIRRNERTRNIPIVFVTAHDREEAHVRRGYDSGAVDYLFKPYDPLVLRSKVAAFVALHRAQARIVEQAELLREAQRREHAHALAQLELRSLRRQESAQRRYRALVDGVTHAIAWMAEPTTLLVTFAGPSVRAILGVEPDAWVADPTPFVDRVHAADREAFRAAVAALHAAGDSARLQHRMDTAGGERVWLDTALRLVPGEDGERLELHGYSVDVTEALRAREALQFVAQAGDELARSLECAETAAAVARLPVPELADWCAVELFPDPGGGDRVIAAAHPDPAQEPLARALAGHPSLARLGPCRALRVVHDLRRKLLRDDDPGCAELLDALGPASLLEFPLRGHGRTLGVVRLFSRPERPPAGARERALVGELGRRAAQALENALLYRQAREAVRMREDFLAIASHELRTPLSALALQMRLLDGMVTSGKLALTPTAAADLQRRVHTGVRQVDRLTTLVNSLLDLARIRAGTVQLELERLDLREVVREVAARHEDSLAKAGRALELDDGGTAALGRWDRSRLDQLFTNLVSNAVKYGGEGPISVVIRAQPGHVSLAVRDRGPGIPPGELEAIFERFTQGSSARSSSGLGLGLFISRKIVEAHGGRIRAESVLGAGTTFVVELPCDDEVDAAAQAV